MANMLKQANDMQTSIDTLQKMQNITVQMAATTHSMVTKFEGHGRRPGPIAGQHRQFR